MSDVLLFSGGMDSFMAWRLLGHPRCLYVALDHRYQFRELETIQVLTELTKRLPQSLDVEIINRLSLGDLEQPDGFIPLRNLLLAACATLSGASTVYLGGLRGESSRDKSRRFFRDASRLLTFLEGRPVQVQAPFRHMTKTQLVRTYLRRFPDGPFALLATRSCYAEFSMQDVVGCGRCMACFRRWVAMTNNGITEAYQETPWTWNVVQSRDWPAWRAKLMKVPVVEWPGVLHNNLDARKAMRYVSPPTFPSNA